MAMTTDLVLDIEGLPVLAGGLIKGGSYLCQVSSPLAHQSMVAQTIAGALKSGFPVVLCTGGAPERVLDRCRELGLGDLSLAISKGFLKVFALQNGAAKNVFRLGPQRFMIELEHFHVPDGAFILFDGAEEIFTVQDGYVAGEQAKVYRDWIQRHHCRALFCFSLLAPGGQSGSTYQALLDHVDGAVRIESGRGVLEYVVEFWRSPLGVVASRTLNARLDDHGRLSVFEAAPVAGNGAAADTGPAGDEDVVYSLDTTLKGLAGQGAGRWHFADNLVAMLHATRNAKAATVILGYTRATDLRELAQAAHTLRVTLGNRVRLVVRELDASLRYQNELLLLKLGVNLVVHREVPVARLPLALETLRGQTFSRQLEVDFDAALAAVTPMAIRGPVPLDRFVGAAREIVERSRAVGVPYALVNMPLPEGVALGQWVERFKINRDGDFLSASGNRLALFLSACAQANVLATIQRQLGEQAAVDALPPMEFALNETEVTTLLAQLEHEGAHPAFAAGAA